MIPPIQRCAVHGTDSTCVGARRPSRHGRREKQPPCQPVRRVLTFQRIPSCYPLGWYCLGPFCPVLKECALPRNPIPFLSTAVACKRTTTGADDAAPFQIVRGAVPIVPPPFLMYGCGSCVGIASRNAFTCFFVNASRTNGRRRLGPSFPRADRTRGNERCSCLLIDARQRFDPRVTHDFVRGSVEQYPDSRS
jgi:hypothetical protein